MTKGLILKKGIIKMPFFYPTKMSRIVSKKTQVPYSLAVFLTTVFLSFAGVIIYVNEADAAIALRGVSPVVWGEMANIPSASRWGPLQMIS